MRIPLVVTCLLAVFAVVVNAKKASPFYRIESNKQDAVKSIEVKPSKKFDLPPSTHRKLQHSGRRNNNRRSLVERDLQRRLEPTAIRSSDYDTADRRPRMIDRNRKLALHNAGGTRSAGQSYASTYNHHVKEEEKKYEDVSTNEGDYEYYEDNDQDKGKYGEHAVTDDDEYYYGSRPSSGDDDDGKGRGGKGYGYSYGSSSSYSSRSSKSSKSTKSEKSSKSGKSSRGGKPTTKPVPHPTPAPTEYAAKPPGQKDYIRFVMVREEAGTPVPGYFGIGDSLALNGQVYYWEGVGDKVISQVPSGNFVALCTGVTTKDDLLCTYEIVLKVAKEHETSSGVGVLTAHGVNYYEENDMVVTGTEFDFAKYHGGTLVTVEDPVQPYLYATLYLI